MIIDFHTHIFPDAIAPRAIALLEQKEEIKATTNGTADALLSSMKQTGVDLSIVLPVATKPDQFETINAYAKKINETYAGVFLSFGGIHPDSPDYKKELNYIKELGLPGIKLHPDYQGVMIDDVRMMNIIEYADALGLIIVTHAGIDIGIPETVHCPPDKMRKVMDTIKPKKMIAAHYGGWKQWEMVYEYLAGTPIYLDTAFTFDYIEQDMFMKIYEKHDKDKILFATDCPWSDVGKSIEIVRNLSISEQEKENLFVNNAKKVLTNPCFSALII